jgi:C-5 cytosine-specific DNA methylase
MTSRWSGGPHPSLSQSHNTGSIGQSNQELFSQGCANLVPVPIHNPAVTLTAREHKDPLPEADLSTGISYAPDAANTLRAEGFDAGEDGTGRGLPLVAPCLTSNYGKQPDNSDTSGGPMLVPVAFPLLEVGARTGRSTDDPRVGMASARQRTLCSHSNRASSMVLPFFCAGATAESTEGAAPALRTSQGGGNKPQVLLRSIVRRLTPVECERLRGFPDNYTLVPVGKKTAADGPRYTALGNSMAVPVMRWIGERICAAESTAMLLESSRTSFRDAAN